MLQSMGSQRVGHDLVTEKQEYKISGKQASSQEQDVDQCLPGAGGRQNGSHCLISTEYVSG